MPHLRAVTTWIGRGLLLALGTAPLLHAGVQTLQQAKVANRIFPSVLVLAPAWSSQIPPTGSVNAPATLSSVASGQRIVLALAAEGPDRDKLLGEAVISVRFVSATRGSAEEHGLRPVAVRRIKAEGSDMALLALEAGGIAQADRSQIQAAMSLVSFALFQPQWTAPAAKDAEEIQISVQLTAASAADQPPTRTIRLRPVSDWLKDPPIGMEEFGKAMNRYQEDLPPGRVLALLRSVVAAGQLGNPTLASFFACALQNDATRQAAIAALPSLEPELQAGLLYMLRLSGQDTRSLKANVPANVLESLNGVAPLPDPRPLLHLPSPVKPEAVQAIGLNMDQCWSAWMATGDQSYLRALVGLLGYAPDYPAYQAWLKAKGGVRGLNDAVGRGLAYQIAGWSLRSFEFHDPHASDWLRYWQEDPAFPAELRREIKGLPTNPAFERQ